MIEEGVHPSLHIQYKNFDLKQYFKEGRGLRTEGTPCPCAKRAEKLATFVKNMIRSDD